MVRYGATTFPVAVANRVREGTTADRRTAVAGKAHTELRLRYDTARLSFRGGPALSRRERGLLLLVGPTGRWVTAPSAGRPCAPNRCFAVRSFD